MNLALALLSVMVGAYAGATVLSMLAPGRRGQILSTGATVLGAISSLALAGVVLAGGALPVATVPWFVLAPLRFQLDPLGAFFLAVVGMVALPAGLYGYGYMASATPAARRSVGALINLLVLSMSLQVMADNALTFLFAWEIVSLSACFLVLTERDQPGAVSAANWYLGVTHAGFLALLAMFLLLSGGDLSASFAEMRGGASAGALRHAVFVLALVGFGSKAGILPLHIWLPRAHPVAPSHASALMSGVVLKMGVYGLVRVVFDLLGPGPAWWGVVVLTLGTASALFGVLYALMQQDLKRLLAFSSIENIGIIFMGVGASLLFHTYGLPLLAALALIAALYHTINHAAFKSLLFLAAGAAVHAAHSRNIEHMGGLIKGMPRTAFAFLVGAAATSALPPLNGFVSEWLLFQSLLGGVKIPVPGVALLMPISVGFLALTSGLAAAAFVKAFGITFLAIPRSPEAEKATEVTSSLQAAMLILVVACVALGLGPFAVVPILGAIVSRLPGLEVAASLGAEHGLFSGLPTGMGQMSTPLIGLGLLSVGLLVALVLRVLAPTFRMRRAETWGCGRLVQTPRMQYTAAAFAEPLRRVFSQLFRPTEDVTVDLHPGSSYFIRAINYEHKVAPPFDRLVYAPSLALIRRLAANVRSVQAGSVHLYLAYLCVALVALLIAARWLP
jgi:hydrogenase-4 component B